MALIKDSENMILLLSGLTSKQDKLIGLYIGRIKQTKEYQGTQNLDQYEYISDPAKQLRTRMQAIDIDRPTIAEVQAEHQKLIGLFKDFQSLEESSADRLRNGQYHLDLVSKEKLEALKERDPDLYAKMEIMRDAGANSPAEAFRNYLKTHPNSAISAEYKQNRTPELEDRDRKRGKLFIWGGGAIGAVVFMLLGHLFQPVPFAVEIGMIMISLILFGVGMKRHTWSLRLYALGLLAAYILLLTGASFMQEFGWLPKTFNEQSLRVLHLDMLFGFAGALLGVNTGIQVNFIPFHLRFQYPTILLYIERHFLFCVLAFGIFGFVWTHAFFDNKTVYQSIAATVEKSLESISGDSETSDAKTLGTLVVTAGTANIRTEPAVTEETITGQVTKGTVLTYYDHKKVGKRTWYQVLNEDSGDLVWISEIAVQKKK